jgi:hypothetical protein
VRSRREVGGDMACGLGKERGKGVSRQASLADIITDNPPVTCKYIHRPFPAPSLGMYTLTIIVEGCMCRATPKFAMGLLKSARTDADGGGKMRSKKCYARNFRLFGNAKTDW